MSSFLVSILPSGVSCRQRNVITGEGGSGGGDDVEIWDGKWDGVSVCVCGKVGIRKPQIQRVDGLWMRGRL